MATEDDLLAAIRAAPGDITVREVYADWLEERGDPRCHFVRSHLATSPLPPDHPDRLAKEEELSRWRRGCTEDWLAVIEPERAHQLEDPVPRGCSCFRTAGGDDDDDDDEPASWLQPDFDREPQDTECDAWKRLLDLVEHAAGRSGAFDPFRELPPEDRVRIVTLPPTIAKLTSITSLDLYASHLVRIPPEIGQMRSLTSFVPYTSYRLHWFPYEITRCTNLRRSTVSTRALYGNFKTGLPFPKLGPISRAVRRSCSVCDREFDDSGDHRVWISLRVAGDVLPLLVNACSASCIASLPRPPDGYVSGPHRGGVERVRPPRS